MHVSCILIELHAPGGSLFIGVALDNIAEAATWGISLKSRLLMLRAEVGGDISVAVVLLEA